MKNPATGYNICACWYVILLAVILPLDVQSQSMTLHSISTRRQTGGDNGYTLDGSRMINNAREKLLDASNFGSSGIYPKSVEIVDAYETSGSLSQMLGMPTSHLFFYGTFFKSDPSLNYFSGAEIDALYSWSKKGGKVIHCAGFKLGAVDSEIMNTRWGYQFTTLPNSSILPNTEGLNTSIFSGPFGPVDGVNQAMAAQGYFSTLPPDVKILGVDAGGRPTMFLDCATLDLVVADVDVFTDFGGVTSGGSIQNANDKLWANAIVFMDEMQQPPVVTKSGGTLNTGTNFIGYQWYKDDSALVNSNSSYWEPASPGTYYVEVEVNGGCLVKSNKLVYKDAIDPVDSTAPCEPFIPSAFSPDDNGKNDSACVFGPCIEEMDFCIYNRWGEMVFQSKNQYKCWDGYFKGEKVNNGVFAWTLKAKLTTGKKMIKKGNMTVIH